MRTHTFHIPVMGLAFTIDTPVKVARFGISSALSIVDDILIEHMREYYYRLLGETYHPISKHQDDFRARRITDYLNLVHRIVSKQLEEVKAAAFEAGSELVRYCELLADSSPLKMVYQAMQKTEDREEKTRLQHLLRSSVTAGSIDVNIMTKLDKINYTKHGDALPVEFADALAALRGFAQSDLHSSVVLSAGMNPRLYAYLENFDAFYPDEKGELKKKIILKVSDYRSAYIQGKFLAKKGLWVSEFRVESGLNCGGHAFATDGYLLGPIMEEFKTKREELLAELHALCSRAWEARGIPSVQQDMTIAVQGGVGTAREHTFLLRYYEVDSIGWGSPFLLVPEVTNVDTDTLNKLAAAEEQDFYISGLSPLGVPFNAFRGTSSDEQKLQRIRSGKPGSPCTKKYLVSNTEFTEKPICTASRQYQRLKIKQLESMNLQPEEFTTRYEEIVEKDCLCEGLAASALIKNNLSTNRRQAVVICPGPNLAYFHRIATLEEMVGHIYGSNDLLEGVERSHMVVNELRMYVEYLQKSMKGYDTPPSAAQKKQFANFKANLLQGIAYYRTILLQMREETEQAREQMAGEFDRYESMLMAMHLPEEASVPSCLV